MTFQTTFCVCFSFMGNVETLIKYISIVGMIRTCFTVIALIVIKLKKVPVAKNAVKVCHMPILYPCSLVQHFLAFPQSSPPTWPHFHSICSRLGTECDRNWTVYTCLGCLLHLRVS